MDKYNTIHSGYFYSASLGPPQLRGAPYTERILCRNFTPKRDESRPFGRKATNLPMSHPSPRDCFCSSKNDTTRLPRKNARMIGALPKFGHISDYMRDV